MNYYLDAKAIQQKTGLSRPKVYELQNCADCPVIRIGRSIRVPEDDFDRWMRERFGNPCAADDARRNEM